MRGFMRGFDNRIIAHAVINADTAVVVVLDVVLPGSLPAFRHGEEPGYEATHTHIHSVLPILVSKASVGGL